jgi:hypothetical protein
MKINQTIFTLNYQKSNYQKLISFFIFTCFKIDTEFLLPEIFRELV